jgi:N-acetylneuraminate lyase
MEALRLDGLVVAAATPMKESGEVNFDLIPGIVDHYVRHGMVGVYVLGTTGEGMLLTDQERQEVAAAYVEAIGGRMKTILQVGHSSLKTSAVLAAHGEKLGVDAVSATPPGYFKPNDEKGLVEDLGIMTEAAPNTPFYYYHIPVLSGVTLDPMKLTGIALDRLPTFVGIKYSDGATLHNLPLLQAIDERLEFMSGSGEGYLQCLAQGYKAAICSTYGFAAPIYQEVRKAFEAGRLEEARMWQARALEMIHHLFRACGRGGLKEMMKLVGLDCGPVRRPLDPVTPEQFAELKRTMERIGWFEWVGSEHVVAA